MDPVERAQAVQQVLHEVYGDPDLGDPLPALDVLILTILSQNTNDTNRDRAYTLLRAALPNWEMVRDAPTEAVIEAIRPAGLANQKGPRIQETLRSITAQRGFLDLDFLADLPVKQGQQWLMQFKGVGPKTAAIVLLFSFGKPAFPVDTHIYRVTGRVGLRPLKMSVEDAHQYLAQLFRPEDYAAVHLNIIRLGREVCKARSPNCPACPVRHVCEYGSKG
jgi:endonuclease III